MRGSDTQQGRMWSYSQPVCSTALVNLVFLLWTTAYDLIRMRNLLDGAA